MIKILNKEKWNLLQLFALKTLGAGLGFIFLKFILVKFGAPQILIYSEYRRFASFAIIILFLGYHVTLPIENLSKNENQNQIIVPIIFTLIFSALLCVVDFSMAYFALHLTASMFLSSIFTIDRAEGKLIKGSQLLFILSSVVPLIIAYGVNDIFFYFKAYFVVMTFFILWKLNKMAFNDFKINVSLLNKSIGRIFQDMMNVLLPFLIVFIAKDEASGYRAFIMSLIMGFYLIKSPFNLLMADLMARGKFDGRSKKYFFVTLVIIMILTLIYKLSLNSINSFYFKNSIFLDELNRSVYFIFPYFLYLSLRNFLDIYIQNKITNFFAIFTIVLFFILVKFGFSCYLAGAIAYLFMNFYIIYLFFNCNLKA